MDIKTLRSIVESSMRVPEGHTPMSLLPELMQGLGSTDYEMRERLCLRLLASWITAGRYSAGDLATMVPRLLGNLKAGLGNAESDTVFLRSFTALVLATVVRYDLKEKVLAEPVLRSILEGALHYLSHEKDLRGFVPEKGWAHAAAHAADLLVPLSTHPSITLRDLDSILEVVSDKILAPTPYRLVELEGFRLGRVVIVMVQDGRLPLANLAAWLRKLEGDTPWYKTYVMGRDNAVQHNVVSLLLSLHVMLSYGDIPPAEREHLLPVVHGALKSFAPWFV